MAPKKTTLSSPIRKGRTSKRSPKKEAPKITKALSFVTSDELIEIYRILKKDFDTIIYSAIYWSGPLLDTEEGAATLANVIRKAFVGRAGKEIYGRNSCFLSLAPELSDSDKQYEGLLSHIFSDADVDFYVQDGRIPATRDSLLMFSKSMIRQIDEFVKQKKIFPNAMYGFKVSGYTGAIPRWKCEKTPEELVRTARPDGRSKLSRQDTPWQKLLLDDLSRRGMQELFKDNLQQQINSPMPGIYYLPLCCQELDKIRRTRAERLVAKTMAELSAWILANCEQEDFPLLFCPAIANI